MQKWEEGRGERFSGNQMRLPRIFQKNKIDDKPELRFFKRI